MKNKGYWIGSVIILFLSVICFVVFGVGTEIISAISGAGNPTVFGKYDGKKIELVPGSDFAQAVQNYSDYFQRQGQTLDDNAYFYIYNYAFNAAVMSTAYKSEVAKSGYKPSEKAISRVILPYFSKDGKYDPVLYASYPESDKAALRNDIAKQLSYSRFAEDVFGSDSKVGGNSLFGTKKSSKEAAFLKDFAAAKKTFIIASFDKTSYPDSEIMAYAKENADNFNSYSLLIVTVKEEAQAKKLQKQITGNELTFEDAVKEYSEKYFGNGDGVIENKYEYQVKGIFDKSEDIAKVDGLKKDEVSEVIKTNEGYSIFKATEEKTTANLADETTFNAVKDYIKVNESGRIEEYFTAKANDFAKAAEGVDFVKTARTMGVKVSSTVKFPLNYGDLSIADKLPSEDEPALANASSNEFFLEKAFALKANEISEPVVNGNYILVVKNIAAENDEVSSEASEALQNELSEYDQTSAQSVILNSKKVENNVTTVYFNNYLKK